MNSDYVLISDPLNNHNKHITTWMKGVCQTSTLENLCLHSWTMCYLIWCHIGMLRWDSIKRDIQILERGRGGWYIFHWGKITIQSRRCKFQHLCTCSETGSMTMSTSSRSSWLTAGMSDTKAFWDISEGAARNQCFKHGNVQDSHSGIWI